MSGIRTAVAVLAATVIAGGALVRAAQAPAAAAPQPARGATPPAPTAAQQGTGQTPSPLPLSQTVRERGSSVTGSFEGWYVGKDGNNYALLGYFNRNTKQELDVPIGPNNRIEPGGPDQGQPTHFATGRARGTFTVKLPKDMTGKKLIWTLVANGFTNTITIQNYPTYIVEPYENSTTHAVPPVVKIEPNGPTFSGPPAGIGLNLNATVGTPLALVTTVTQTNVGRGGGGGGGGGGAPGRGGRGAPGAAPAAPTDGAASTDSAAAGAASGAGTTATNAANAADPAAAAAGRGGGRGGGGRGGRGGGAAGGAAAAGGGAAGRGGAAAAFAGRGGGGAASPWTKFRGTGNVTFTAVPAAAGSADAAAPARGGGARGGNTTETKSTTNATFDAAGDYMIRFQAGNPNGEQCCWTNVLAKVTVK